MYTNLDLHGVVLVPPTGRGIFLSSNKESISLWSTLFYISRPSVSIVQLFYSFNAVNNMHYLGYTAYLLKWILKRLLKKLVFIFAIINFLWKSSEVIQYIGPVSISYSHLLTTQTNLTSNFNYIEHPKSNNLQKQTRNLTYIKIHIYKSQQGLWKSF